MPTISRLPVRLGAAIGRGVGRFLLALAAASAMLPFAAPASAQTVDEDLPARVGRVGDFSGQLYLSPQDRPSEWSAVGINYPVTSGDSLWVSGEGRAEVDYGGGQFRIAGDTNLNVSRLDDRQLTLFVAQGRLIVRVRVLDTGDAVRVDTPNTQVALTRPGLYRIDVTPDQQGTIVGVREGEALVGLANGAHQALAGETVTVSGYDALAADVRSGVGIDGFDAWSANRDRRYERGRATAFVSRQMVGYAELDEYGTWETTPAYGPVWVPTTVAPDWAPYRDGYWTNVGGWGLTWVDAAAWGYAPSHYGRWVRVNARWAWCPGAYVARPYWAPALVGWFGGARWGLTANAGAPVYAWVPLGWGDPFQPWWRGCSQACWTHYNRHFAVGNAARPGMPPDRYAHTSVPGALTAVAGATLVDRKPVPGNRVHVPATQLASAPALTGAPTVTPGQGHAPVFRPGERGTPVPASTLYGDARRHRSPAPGGPVTPSRQAGATPPAQASGIAGAPSVPATRQRPAPVPTTAPTSAPIPGVAATAPAGLKTVAPVAGPAKPAVAIDGNAASATAAPLEGQPTKRHHAGPDVPAGSAGRPASSPSPSPGAAGVAMPATMAPAVKAAPAPLPSPQPAAPAPGVVPGTPVERGHAAAAKAAADADAAKAKAADRNAAGAQGQAPAPR